jgi:hypothetical protein
MTEGSELIVVIMSNKAPYPSEVNDLSWVAADAAFELDSVINGYAETPYEVKSVQKLLEVFKATINEEGEGLQRIASAGMFLIVGPAISGSKEFRDEKLQDFYSITDGLQKTMENFIGHKSTEPDDLRKLKESCIRLARAATTATMTASDTYFDDLKSKIPESCLSTV